MLKVYREIDPNFEIQYQHFLLYLIVIIPQHVR